MTEPANPPLASSPLQFDTAVHTAAHRQTSGVVCSECHAAIVDSYFTLAHRPFCVVCKTRVEDAWAMARKKRTFAKAFAYGLGAAIAGAIIYYAVIALLDLEIGLVAILIGYMVGYAVKRAMGTGGGRRFQVLAAVLTYYSVGLAYLPVAIKGAWSAAQTDSARVISSDSGKASVTAPAPAPAASSVADSVPAASSPADTITTTVDITPSSTSGLLIGVGVLLGGAFILPVIIVFGSMPSGLISALIILFGMQQAWKMTAAPGLAFHGPLSVAPKYTT